MYNGCLPHDQVIEHICSVREESTAQRAGKICAVHWWLDGNDLDANLALQDGHDFFLSPLVSSSPALPLASKLRPLPPVFALKLLLPALSLTSDLKPLSPASDPKPLPPMSGSWSAADESSTGEESPLCSRTSELKP